MIPEDLITKHINFLLGSEPGDEVSQLHVVSAPESAIGPLGLANPATLSTALYAIAPPEGADPVEFIIRAIRSAHTEHVDRGKIPLFAALGQEVWTVKREIYGATREYVPESLSLHDHPDAVEATLVYAACRDGRRWRVMHTLTGPEAGPAHDVQLLLGLPDPEEAFGSRWGQHLRRIVGQVG